MKTRKEHHPEYDLSCGCHMGMSRPYHQRVANTVVCAFHGFRVFIVATRLFPRDED